MLEVIIEYEEIRVDLINKWVIQKSKSGAIYLSQVNKKGLLGVECAWAYEKQDDIVTFSNHSIRYFTNRDKYIVCDDREVELFSKIGGILILAYTNKASLDHPDSKSRPMRKCSKCGSSNIRSYSRQMDFADEPPDIFHRCEDCHSVDREMGFI